MGTTHYRSARSQTDESRVSLHSEPASTAQHPTEIAPPPLNTAAHARFGPSYFSRSPRPIVQAKMTVGPVGDAYEQEADAVAQQVVQSIQRQEMDEDELQRTPAPPTLQRAEAEEELQMKPLFASITPIQRTGEDDELQMNGEGIGASGGALEGSLESTIQSAKGSGSPLSDSVRKPMEQAFGADFSKVRVHNDSTADSLNRSIQAKAFTTGQDVFFRSGAYQPTSKQGKELLAHELTHTIQQGGVNQAANRKLQDSETVQRFTFVGDEGDKGSTRISDTGKFGMVESGGKELLATPEAIAEANLALTNVGALVLLQPHGAPTASGWVQVIPTINPTAVKSRIWTRLASKQPNAAGGADQPVGFRAFADCFRTGGTVAGIDPGKTREQATELRLPTGTVPVLSTQEGRAYGAGTPAARAAASFFMHALPLFLPVLATFEQNEQRATMAARIRSFQNASGATKTGFGLAIYKLILADPDAKARFVTMFGINGSAAPAIGTALTQVNDPAEKEAAPSGENKWNFHWAGVIMTDGSDYVTLENCAVELEEATAGEMAENSDIYYDAENPKARAVKNQRDTKQDMINDRWYFKLYGQGNHSFHEEMLRDPHATPSAITLPLSKT